MDEIKRYAPNEFGVMIECITGSWVRWDDLIVLKSALQSARAENERKSISYEKRLSNLLISLKCGEPNRFINEASADDYTDYGEQISKHIQELKAEVAKMREAFIKHLYEHCGGLRSLDLKPRETRKPTHGNCCTCQECGWPHDECVCEHNKWCEYFNPAAPEKAEKGTGK